METTFLRHSMRSFDLPGAIAAIRAGFFAVAFLRFPNRKGVDCLKKIPSLGSVDTYEPEDEQNLREDLSGPRIL